MVTDKQVRILMKLINQEKALETAAAKAGMSAKTARKYRQSGKLPSQCKPDHTWRTRQDPFEEDDWHWAEDFLKTNPGLEANVKNLVNTKMGNCGRSNGGLEYGEPCTDPVKKCISLKSMSQASGANRISPG